jgi:hypothetical protein
MTKTLEIKASVRDLFRQVGLEDYRDFMESCPGEEISNLRLREVRRFEVQGAQGTERFFLKRRGSEPPLRLLRMLIYGQRPTSGAGREYMMANLLRSAGFEAMEPVAWGETRLGGVPREGFLVVRAVPGESVAEVFERTAPPERRILMERVGELLGRLHRQRFTQVVRLKDVILRPDGALVLIDRETGKPRRSFSLRLCEEGVRSLARGARRTMRDGHVIGPGSFCAFLRSYRQAFPVSGHCTDLEFTRKVIRQLRAELGRNPNWSRPNRSLRRHGR